MSRTVRAAAATARRRRGRIESQEALRTWFSGPTWGRDPIFRVDRRRSQSTETSGSRIVGSCCRRGGAAQWVVDAFAKNGIKYRHSDRDRSAIYADCLPIFTSGRARLLDSARLANQFASLERKTSSLGRDKIDHGPGGHDDLCNAAALSMVLASVEKKMVFHSPELNYGGGSYYRSFHNGAHVPAGPFELGASMSSPPDLRC